jgi:hypothetical protein
MMRVSCKEASLLASQSLDRRLRLSERVTLRLHLFVCEACTRFRHQIEFLRIAVRGDTDKWDNDHLDGLSNEARARIRQTLQRS